ncbi:MAG: ATP-binding protein [Betaproteobacteria bacterium]|nr:ATP-binding protein [Betaproteobacteria bacterium]MDH5341299.1 ATP-binding protein [Betaproteobacteria bacterium]
MRILENDPRIPVPAMPPTSSPQPQNMAKAGNLHNLRLPLIAVIAVLLVALLGFLYLKSQGVDYRVQGDILDYLRELKEIDGRGDLDVLRARVEGTSGKMRPIGERNARIPELLRRLQQSSGLVSSPTLNRNLPALVEAFERKTELLNRYQAAGDTVTEALGRMVTFDSEIAGLVRGAWESYPQRDRLVAIESTAALLFAHVMRYAADPTDAQRQNVEVFAADLRKAGSGTPAALREGLARMDNTVQQILGAKPVENDLFGKITIASAGPRIDSLTNAFTAETANIQTDSERYRIYLIAYAGALLILIGYLLSRLAVSYRLLESRVEERTRELSDALRQLKESESQLIQTEKMSSLGQMVAGVAHEINTPLAYVKNSLSAVAGQLPEVKKLIVETNKLLRLMEDNSPDPERLRVKYTAVRDLIHYFAGEQALAEMGKLAQDGLYGIEQISEIVVNLKNFSRLDRSKVSSFNLNEGLESALILAKHELKHLTVKKNLGEIPAITCSPSQLNQVFLNLINNAAQAIETGSGEITLSTRIEDPEHVAVEIADNGKGIPPEIISKIFDPFFTTKGVGKGTGLGLSISYKIIEQHGGRISVDSTPGQGTRFTIVLPLTPLETADPDDLT